MVKGSWNVLVHNVNSNTIETYDVFKHRSFVKDVDKLRRKNLQRDEFSEELRRIAQYYFWSKCEWEVVVSSWPVYINEKELRRANTEHSEHQKKYGRTLCAINISPTGSKKIDVYDQLLLNWSKFEAYCYVKFGQKK